MNIFETISLVLVGAPVVLVAVAIIVAGVVGMINSLWNDGHTIAATVLSMWMLSVFVLSVIGAIL